MHFGWHIISSYLIFNPFYQTDIFLLSVRIPQPYTMLPTGFVRAFRLRMCYPNKGVMDTTPHAWKSIMAFSEVSYFAFFILYTCFDTNCRRACIPLVSNLYFLRIRGADFGTLFFLCRLNLLPTAKMRKVGVLRCAFLRRIGSCKTRACAHSHQLLLLSKPGLT